MAVPETEIFPEEQKKKKTLTVDEKLNVAYCIPLFLRDLQIQEAIQRVKGRLEPHHEKRAEPIAVVNFGPSLNDTWEEIKKFKNIITCSGSHKFLLDHGITPHPEGHWFHIDVDPRAHKATLIGTPHKDVQYLIASTCHRAVFDLLEGYNVKLWHIFDATEDGLRLLPAGEWAVTGGCSAGLRTMTMARVLGFTDLHIFGMDGCEGKSGKHAAAHPNQPKGASECVIHGITFQTTPSMLEAAKQTFHELDQMKDVVPHFYGEGLVQELAKDWSRKENVVKIADLAYSKPELISDEYRAINEKLHRDNLVYGVGGAKHVEIVNKLVATLAQESNGIPVSVGDYGCGKSQLAKALPFPIFEYDPAIPGKQEPLRPVDLLVCTDVLEHIERAKIHYVLDDMRRCCKKIGFFTIHTGPAAKTLPTIEGNEFSGKNTHQIQKQEAWWKTKLERYFQVASMQRKGPELFVVVAPLAKKQKPKLSSKPSA